MSAKKVLVAEDDDGIRFAIVSLLEDHGLIVLQATDEATLVAHAQSADVWIIDARLPSKGYEGILAVFSLHCKGITSRVPVLFMSVDAQSFAAERLAGLDRLGIKYEWLDKPFELQHLLERVKAFIQ